MKSRYNTQYSSFGEQKFLYNQLFLLIFQLMFPEKSFMFLGYIDILTKELLFGCNTKLFMKKIYDFVRVSKIRMLIYAGN